MESPRTLFHIYSKLFKIFFIIAFFSLPGFTPAHTAEVTLTWRPPNQQVDGYRIYYAESGQNLRSGNVCQITPMQITSCVIADLEPGITYSFAASCFLGTSESGLSEAVQYQIPEDETSTESLTGSTLEYGCFIKVIKN
ncbi:MAG: fibronectin type III domain-containing protein [Bacteroidota bacterium]